MFKRILLPIDLAELELARPAIDEAVELVQASAGLLRLVNVQPLLPATFMDYVPADFDAAQEKRAAQELDHVAAAISLPKERLTSVVRVGGAYHEILVEAREWRADLIVMGAHRPAMSDYLLGSNAKTIVRHATCSVLVVRR